MKNSTIALLAVAGIGGYFILKQTQQTAAAIQGVAELPLLPYKAAGQVFTGVEQQVVAGSDFVGQAAAQILSNANTVVSIPQKQIEQTANNLLTALPAAVNALNVLNPLTLPLTAAAVTSNALSNALTDYFTPNNISQPAATITSSSSNKVSASTVASLLAPSKVTNAGTTSTGYYNPTTSVFTSTQGYSLSVAPTAVSKNVAATPFSTTVSKPTTTATTGAVYSGANQNSSKAPTVTKNYFGTTSTSKYF